MDEDWIDENRIDELDHLRATLNLESTRVHLVSSLLLSHTVQLREARKRLFEGARRASLAHPKDILFKRLKYTVGPLLKKYALDVTELVFVLKSNLTISHILLKNRKCAAAGDNLKKHAAHLNHQKEDVLPNHAEWHCVHTDIDLLKILNMTTSINPTLSVGYKSLHDALNHSPGYAHSWWEDVYLLLWSPKSL